MMHQNRRRFVSSLTASLLVTTVSARPATAAEPLTLCALAALIAAECAKGAISELGARVLNRLFPLEQNAELGTNSIRQIGDVVQQKLEENEVAICASLLHSTTRSFEEYVRSPESRSDSLELLAVQSSNLVSAAMRLKLAGHEVFHLATSLRLAILQEIWRRSSSNGDRGSFQSQLLESYKWSQELHRMWIAWFEDRTGQAVVKQWPLRKEKNVRSDTYSLTVSLIFNGDYYTLGTKKVPWSVNKEPERKAQIYSEFYKNIPVLRDTFIEERLKPARDKFIEPARDVRTTWREWCRKVDGGQSTFLAFDGPIDAGVSFEFGRSYLFRNDRYIRYDSRIGEALPGYSRQIKSAWAGMPFTDGVDAACNGGENGIYFFKGNSYAAYSSANDRAIDNAPRKISADWKIAFKDGIDAAVEGRGDNIYFFKGNMYQRVDRLTKKADFKPRPISSAWEGMSFTDGIDATLNFHNGHIYFFRGMDYIRYQIGYEKPYGQKADPSYPKKVTAHWSAVFG